MYKGQFSIYVQNIQISDVGAFNIAPHPVKRQAVANMNRIRFMGILFKQNIYTMHQVLLCTFSFVTFAFLQTVIRCPVFQSFNTFSGDFSLLLNTFLGDFSSLLNTFWGVFFFLSEKERSNREGGNDAGKVGNETTCNGVTCVLNVYGSEINGEDIESSVRCALQDTAETADE